MSSAAKYQYLRIISHYSSQSTFSVIDRMTADRIMEHHVTVRRSRQMLTQSHGRQVLPPGCDQFQRSGPLIGVASGAVTFTGSYKAAGPLPFCGVSGKKGHPTGKLNGTERATFSVHICAL